jgi:hypothetical protein
MRTWFFGSASQWARVRFTIGGFVGMFALLAHGLHWF